VNIETGAKTMNIETGAKTSQVAEIAEGSSAERTVRNPDAGRAIRTVHGVQGRVRQDCPTGSSDACAEARGSTDERSHEPELTPAQARWLDIGERIGAWLVRMRRRLSA